MIESVPWQWDRVSETRWREPDPSVYYLAARWREAGRRRLLDLGAGIGRHALFFAALGFRVDAFDLSPSGLTILKQEVQARGITVRTQLGQMLALPYADATFDCLLAFHVIYHTDRAGLELAIAEIQRVVAPGGEIYVTFNSKQNRSFSDPANTWLDENTVVKHDGVEAGIPHYFVDEPEVRRLLAAFRLDDLTHVERFRADGRSAHYHVLATRP